MLDRDRPHDPKVAVGGRLALGCKVVGLDDSPSFRVAVSLCLHERSVAGGGQVGTVLVGKCEPSGQADYTHNRHPILLPVPLYLLFLLFPYFP